MNQSKLLNFIKRFKAIDLRRKELDREESQWCFDLRSEFPAGKNGDKAFSDWLNLELGIPPERQHECMSRAAAFSIVPDEATWNELGGYKQIRALIPLDKRERVAVIGAAKTTGYRITTVIRQRESKDVTPRQTPDIVLLAEFIESLDDVPEELREVARKYIRARALNVNPTRGQQRASA